MTEVEELRQKLQEAEAIIAKYEAVDTLPPPPQTVEMALPPPSQREREIIAAVANLGETLTDWMGRADRQMNELQRQLKDDMPIVIRNAVSSAMVDIVVDLTTRVAKLEKRTDKVELWQRARAQACEDCEKLAEAGM